MISWCVEIFHCPNRRRMPGMISLTTTLLDWPKIGSSELERVFGQDAVGGRHQKVGVRRAEDERRLDFQNVVEWTIGAQQDAAIAHAVSQVCRVLGCRRQAGAVKD